MSQNVKNTLNMTVAIITILAQLIFVIYFISEMKHQLEIVNIKVDKLAENALTNISDDTEQKTKINNLEKCCENLEKRINNLSTFHK